MPGTLRINIQNLKTKNKYTELELVSGIKQDLNRYMAVM